MKTIAPVLATLVALAAPFAQAQSQAPGTKGERFDCSRAKDPKACEERRDKLLAAHERAQKTCADRQGAEYAQCVAHETCAEAKDPKACEQRFSRLGKEKDARVTCEGKQGAERTDCIVKERCAGAKDPARCEAETRSGMASRAKIREACKDKRGDDLKACIRDQQRS